MFRRVIIPTLTFVIAYLIIPSNLLSQANGYEGTQVCGVCHKTEKQGQQLKIWQDSKHASAFKTLMSEEAKKYSKDVEPSKNPKCLKCHTTGYGSDAKLFGAKFKVEEGVQCEACHGAGSAYKSLKVMKVKADAVKAGMIVHEKKSAYCTGCHNSESPTFKGFDFDKMWAKIAHPVPKG